MSLGTIRRTSGALLILLLAVPFAAPAAAIDKEQRQLMADVRMLQEQNQQLQNILGSIVEAIKAVNTRIDDQAKVTGKAMADQKLTIDNLTNTVREIREKLTRIRPQSIAQASRIPGITPASMSILLFHLEMRRNRPAPESVV